jgi:EAL domain-containing protein (putative c-di-GMP-specific phosphodiesterase class I)
VFACAIDGFGAGYSSLTNLSRFPIDTIKIDGSFVRGLSDHVENRRIADAIIAHGQDLSLTVIAEGVETKAQADFLRERACERAPGLLFQQSPVTAGTRSRNCSRRTGRWPLTPSVASRSLTN